MRRSLLLLLLLAAIAALGVAPGAALAGGCPSAQTVMTSSDSHAVHGYMCAQDNASGSMSIGAGKTHSYNINTNSQMFPWYYCDQASSSSVTIAHGQTWGSASFTATNWLTPSNTRHWSVGILWTAGGYSVSGFSKGCSVNSQVFNNPPAILSMSSISAANVPTGGATAGQKYPITVTVSPSSATGTVAIQDNGVSVASAQLSGGTATIYWTPAVDGTSKVSAVYAGDSGTTPAQGSTYTVPVSGGIGVTINSITLSTTAANTAVANISVAPSTTPGLVALVNVAAGKAIGNAALSAGSANIPFTFTPGSTYTFAAQYLASPTSAPTGQAYPVSWNSTTSKKLATGFSSTLANDLAAFKGTIEGGVDPQARTITATKLGQKAFSVKCASGERMINADAMSTGPVDDIGLGQFTSGGVTVQPSVADKGYAVLAQVICRPAKARQVAVEGITYGTVGPNRIELATAGTGFGGPGRDHLSSRAASSALWGGLGHDTLVVGGDSSTGDGGPGSDAIVAVGTGRHLLIGGEGRDTMVGSFGADLINARDGHGGDLVDCRSAQTRVIADANDIISGPCVQVDTVNGKGSIAS